MAYLNWNACRVHPASTSPLEGAEQEHAEKSLPIISLRFVMVLMI
jgi:hypothetical protein